jgi:HEAT repeat protein
MRLCFVFVIVLTAVIGSRPSQPIHGQQRQPGDPYELVQALGTFPAALPATGRSDGRPDPVEERRLSIYRQLIDLGDQGLPALLRGLVDPDVQIRRNVALFLGVTGSDWGASIAGQLSTDKCLPALITALRDTDERVRHLAAQAIGSIGPKAASAVPALVELLKSPDEGSRNSACIGLGGIGPPARAALPALRDALSDSSPNVRRFAQRAIEKIVANHTDDRAQAASGIRR